MSRSTSQKFVSEPLGQLAKQLLFGPVDVRRAQVRRAEELHDQIDAAVEYPYEFLVYRITGSRGEDDSAPEPRTILGQHAAADLRLIIDMLSKSAPAPLYDGEDAEPVTQLATRLDISTRTIWRWRRTGLRWRWTLEKNRTRPVLVYPKIAVERFIAKYPELVARATAFTQIEPAQRQAIVDRARRLAQARTLTLNQIAKHLARRTGRALETIRQILQQHDRDWPDRPIFPHHQGPLTPSQKRIIARAYSWGISATKIGRRFSRTRITVLRVVRQRRAAELARVRLTFVAMPTFDRPDAEAVILHTPHSEPATDTRRPGRRAPAPRLDDLPAAIRPVFEHPQLPPDEVSGLIVRYNFLKYKASNLRDSLDKQNPSNAVMDNIDAALKLARETRQALLHAHARLALSLVRRHLAGQPEASTARMLELLTVARPVLVDAIEQFDATRGQPFEAFFTWALMRRLAAEPVGVRAHRRADETSLAEWA